MIMVPGQLDTVLEDGLCVRVEILVVVFAVCRESVLLLLLRCATQAGLGSVGVSTPPGHQLPVTPVIPVL